MFNSISAENYRKPEITGTKLNNKHKQEKSEERFMIISISGIEYGLSITNVYGIFKEKVITPLPEYIDFIPGFISSGNKNILVIDLACKLGASLPMKIAIIKQACIIVLKIKGLYTGIIIDKLPVARYICAEEQYKTINRNLIFKSGGKDTSSPDGNGDCLIVDVGSIISSEEKKKNQSLIDSFQFLNGQDKIQMKKQNNVS